jgi:hypothetical protein
MISKLVSSVILKDLKCDCVLTLQDQQNIYTLPDYFSENQDKIADVQTKCQLETIVNQHPWTIDIQQWPNDVDKWISLRCTTKTITFNHEILPESDDNIDHSLLKPLLRKNRSALLTPSYIDKN